MAAEALEQLRHAAEGLRAQSKALELQRGIIGGSVWEALPFLDGWTWQLESLPEPITLTRGAPRKRLVEWSNEEGWAIGFYLLVSDPDVNMRMLVDNWDFTISPRLLNASNDLQIGNAIFRCNVWNPASPYGPIYGITMGPVYPLAYRTRVLIECWYPEKAYWLGVPVASSSAYVYTFHAGKVFISDRKAWYKSLKKFAIQQTLGRREVPLEVIR